MSDLLWFSLNKLAFGWIICYFLSQMILPEIVRKIWRREPEQVSLVRQINHYIGQLNQQAIEMMYPFDQRLRDSGVWKILVRLWQAENLAGDVNLFSLLRYQDDQGHGGEQKFFGPSLMKLQGGWEPYPEKTEYSPETCLGALKYFKSLFEYLDDPFQPGLSVVVFEACLHWSNSRLAALECQHFPKPVGLVWTTKNTLEVQIHDSGQLCLFGSCRPFFDLGLGKEFPLEVGEIGRALISEEEWGKRDLLSERIFQFYQRLTEAGERNFCELCRMERERKNSETLRSPANLLIR